MSSFFMKIYFIISWGGASSYLEEGDSPLILSTLARDICPKLVAQRNLI
jgi:hypothetical protein